MYPDFEEVKKLAATGEYKRIPVMTEMYADAFTPVEVLRKLSAASHHVFLLESASQSENWGRFSFLGYDPELEITCEKHRLVVKEVSEGKEQIIRDERVNHPGEVLREYQRAYKSPAISGQPHFTGGLVGYFSYDYIRYGEPKLRLTEGEGEDFKDMDLMLFNSIIAFDHYKQKIQIITGVMTDDLESSYKAAQDRVAAIRAVIRGENRKDFEKIKLLSEIEPKFSKERYSDMVNKAKHYIKEGDIFQVVLSNPMTAKVQGSLFDTYRVLRTQNPSPYMFYFASDDIEMAGASPETLAKLEDGVVSTFPLAGTRPRGKDRQEDLKNEQDLLSDEKELAEHNMLVDLGRNDVGRVAELGSVKVEKYMGIERYSYVMHIGSTVTGKIAKNKDSIDCVDSILPAGTLSGAPKFRACEIIDELEGSRRGVYGGAIGYLDFTGNMDVCIAIRLVYKKKDEICIRSGAGIVADSVPEKEFEECKNKAKAVVKAIEQAEEGLE